MYEYGLQLIPALSPQLESFDALELKSCGITPPTFGKPERLLPMPSAGGATFYVDYKGGSDANAGSKVAPFRTIAHGVSAARAAASKATVILLAGVHFLQETIELGPDDSGLTITSDPSAKSGDVSVSGGVALKTSWTKVAGAKSNIWVTDVSEDIGATLKGLNTLANRRVTKARYPNGDPELCTNCWKSEDLITNWQADVSCVGKARVVYKDLRGCVGKTGKLPDGSPCKADSAMWDSYNTYTNGHGKSPAPSVVSSGHK
jgi:hypothetical protein